jgi:hypothetical protein
MFKTLAAAAIALAGAGFMVGCSNDADVASHNLSQAADNFQINRRIVFINGFTNDYIFEIEGLCSLGSASSSHGITVTCKTGPNDFKKHILGLSDNVTFFVEQLDATPTSVYHYRVTFKPETIVPSVDLR